LKVQNLAKELSISPRELLKFIREINIKVKSGSTRLDPSTENRIRDQYKHRIKIAEEKIIDKSVAPSKIVLKQKNLKLSALVELFNLSVPEVMGVILEKGLLLSINSDINQETAVEIGKSLNIELEIEDTSVEEEIGLKSRVMEIESASLSETDSDMKSRPPVITIMGHVDHGKTHLLDSIRKSHVLNKEAGGITQHIGAYQIQHKGNPLTFLDTPGHEAFALLRARGAQVTDITILVVAGDDGVKPQTIEAINHAKAADVPIIVAVNKMDKPDADIARVKQELSQHELLSEDFGGDVIMVPVSAKTGKGIDELLEMIELVTEMLELKANRNSLAKAVVIESHLSKQKGPVATLLVKTGTLSVGENFIVDLTYGKVRALVNDLGAPLKVAMPGDPIEIIGIHDVPEPGSILEVMRSEKEIHVLVKERNAQLKSDRLHQQAVSLESLSSQIDDEELRQLNLIIKTDVHGSLEAIKGSINKIESKDVPIRLLHAATGTINENDVMLAKASSALILGFGVTTTSEAVVLAEKDTISIKIYDVIYEMLDDIEKVIKGLYRPEFEEVEIAQIEVRQLFKFSKVGSIAGCYVTEGKIDRNSKIKVIRDSNEVAVSDIESLKRFKEDVKEVSSGFECGIVLASFNALQEGDHLIGFKLQEKR
jgi:translation initiation factor IF-2